MRKSWSVIECVLGAEDLTVPNNLVRRDETSKVG